MYMHESNIYDSSIYDSSTWCNHTWDELRDAVKNCKTPIEESVATAAIGACRTGVRITDVALSNWDYVCLVERVVEQTRSGVGLSWSARNKMNKTLRTHTVGGIVNVWPEPDCSPGICRIFNRESRCFAEIAVEHLAAFQTWPTGEDPYRGRIVEMPWLKHEDAQTAGDTAKTGTDDQHLLCEKCRDVVRARLTL